MYIYIVVYSLIDQSLNHHYINYAVYENLHGFYCQQKPSSDESEVADEINLNKAKPEDVTAQEDRKSTRLNSSH